MNDDGVRAKRSPFEVIRIDDTQDPFEGISGDSVPFGSGIALYQEAVPLGLKHFGLVHFARIVYRPGQAAADAIERYSSWSVHTTKLPEGGNFGFGEVVETDAKNRTKPIGLRTYVLTGKPIVDHHDIAEAFVSEGDEDIPEISIAMRLTERGSQQLELATAEWIDRRLAIVSHGKVESAPVVRAEIKGGHLQIALGPRSDAEVARAKQLVQEILDK